VLAQDKAARDMGIKGIPAFIIDRRYVANGALPSEDWERIIAELAESGRAPERGAPS